MKVTQSPPQPSAVLPPLPDPATVPTLGVVLSARYLRMSKNAAYAALARGDFPADVIKVGSRTRVITASLRRVLQLDATA